MGVKAVIIGSHFRLCMNSFLIKAFHYLQNSFVGIFNIVYLHRVVSSGDQQADYRVQRCSSVVRAFAHGATGRRIDPS